MDETLSCFVAVQPKNYFDIQLTSHLIQPWRMGRWCVPVIHDGRDTYFVFGTPVKDQLERLIKDLPTLPKIRITKEDDPKGFAKFTLTIV